MSGPKRSDRVDVVADYGRWPKSSRRGSPDPSGNHSGDRLPTRKALTLERTFHQWVYPPVSWPNEGSRSSLVEKQDSRTLERPSPVGLPSGEGPNEGSRPTSVESKRSR